MSSNNKESLNEMINRLTLENESIKRASLQSYIDKMRELERSAIELGDTFASDRFEFCAVSAEQHLKNRR